MEKNKLILLKLPQQVAKGRFCSYLAKRLLLQENSLFLLEDSTLVKVTGSKEVTERQVLAKRKRGSRYHGPYYPRQEPQQIRRCLRGMLPKESRKGASAYRRFFAEGSLDKISSVLKRRKFSFEIYTQVVPVLEKKLGIKRYL